MLLKICLYSTDKNTEYIIDYKVVNYFMGEYVHRFSPSDFQTEHVNQCWTRTQSFCWHLIASYGVEQDNFWQV